MKRIYSEDGTKSAPMWVILIAYIVAAPILLSWVFFSELIRGFGKAFRYAWLDVRIEVETAIHALRNAR